MSNNSFASQGLGGALGGRLGGGGGAARDVLSRSILEHSQAGAGNTSIMDLMTGHAAPSQGEMANRSMSIVKRERSFLSSQKSFFSKKPPEMAAMASAPQATGNIDADDESMSDESEGGVVKKVDAFSDEQSESDDSQDCVIETEGKVKSTGFFHKLRLRDIMKSKGAKKVEIFREGESEEYNSEVDGEIELDTAGVNYDILGVRERTNSIHTPLLNLVLRYEELPEDFDEMLTFDNLHKAR